MILSYDSILGIPTIEGSIKDKNNNSNMGLNLDVPVVIFIVIIIVLFTVLFSTLGKQRENVVNTDDSSTQILTILLGGILLVVVVLNGLQYFYNINLTARLDNIFASSPSIDLTVQQNTSGTNEIIPNSDIKLKEEVFHIPGNNYTYDNADALCKAYGARLATYNELEKSYEDGGEWCSYGWSDKQLALFPTQQDTWKRLQSIKGHENDCGRAGINGGYIANPNIQFGANCYGYKPKITQNDKDMMNSTSLYPKSLKDINEEKRVDYWRNKIPEIIVAPFNKKVWSLI